MKFRNWAFLCAVTFGTAPAFAGYALLSPPSGTVSVGGQLRIPVGGSVAMVGTDKIAANIVTNAGARSVTVPITARIAANAPSVAMAAIRLNPSTLAASVVLGFAASYGLAYLEDQWKKSEQSTVTCTGYRFLGTAVGGSLVCSPSAAAQQWISYSNAGATPTSCNWYGMHYHTVQYSLVSANASGFTVSWQSFDGACGLVTQQATFQWAEVSNITEVQQVLRPAVDADFAAPSVPNGPLPAGLPEALPGVPLPVELPKINPDAQDVPQPIQWPLGAPVPIPGTNPQAYQQPIGEIRPANDASNPWRYDYQDKTIQTLNPAGISDPAVVSPPVTPEVPEIITCGLPGKPPCKIDETGTPTSGTIPQEAVNTSKGSALDKVTELGNLQAPAWSWSFALPSSCSVMTVGPFHTLSVQVDLCQYQSMIHDLVGMIWAAFTVWACVGMVGRAFSVG